MKRFIALLDFTAQGRKTIQESPRRSETFLAQAKAAGVTVNALYWTIGAHDGLLSLDAPDAETATALLLRLAASGNVTTQTLQAFNHDEFEALLAKASG